MQNERENYSWNEQQCPICRTVAKKYVGKRGGASHPANSGVETDLWRCIECGLIYPDPMPFPKGGLGQHYNVDADDYFSAHDAGDKMNSAEGLISEAESILGRKGKLLDVGVGRGEALTAAAQRGWQVEGVEPSATFAEAAEKRTGAKIWREPIEESQMEPSSYDVVLLAAVLEHLYEPDKVIEKIANVLAPGGLLYVDVPNESGLYFRVGNLYQKLRGRNWSVNLAPTFPPYHVFGFGPRSLRLLLSKKGLTPEVWRVYGGTSLVPRRPGAFGLIENAGSKLITALSNIGEMGTYIETWARKSER